MTEEQMQELIAAYEKEKVLMQSTIDGLIADKSNLETETQKLQADIETQGKRLTIALSDLHSTIAERDRYRAANVALQDAIHSATAIIPQFDPIKAIVFDQLKENVTTTIRSTLESIATQYQ
jgi:hypothetical protein